MPVSNGKKIAEGSTYANILKLKSPSEDSEVEAERAVVSPVNIFALSEAKTAIKSGRPARRSEIMTCSPIKISLLNLTKKKRTKYLHDWPTVGQPSYSVKKIDKKKTLRPGVMSDIKGQVQKTGRSALNA